ncbi:uncharacterized protein LOC133184445 isoform X2 [Saccostrea echinata]|uniref:uncharacterized protein LOC133184445 isoform X2 n=1 Tax=Saccostrea echinata TaxID=191078 RepID=UPI002A8380F7|nr:uncharacterized protein LOC133184445 isoform X2 [Saccostrea echinata]
MQKCYQTENEAPPSYEEATSSNPFMVPQIQGYTPVSCGFNGSTIGSTGEPPPYSVNFEDLHGGGFTYRQYPSYPADYPSNYPANHYPPPPGYPVVSLTGSYQGQINDRDCRQDRIIGSLYQEDPAIEKQMKRRKIICMLLVVFAVLLAIFAITKGILE